MSRAVRYDADDLMASPIEDRGYLRDNLLADGEVAPPPYVNASRQNSAPYRRVAPAAPIPQHQEPPPPAPPVPPQPSMARQSNPRQYDIPAGPPNLPRQVPPARHGSARQMNNHNLGNARCVISLDYGTTYTGFAYSITDSDDADLNTITVLRNWIPAMNNHRKVRSLISYSPPVNMEVQWGSDISENAVTVVNTKLELEPRDSLLDELDLTLHVLRGTKYLAFDKLPKDGLDPEFPCKSPTEIVTDYLTKVYECAREQSGIKQLVFSGAPVQSRTPVDIVVTVPVNWSYQATDSTFKAVRDAGFNQTNFPTLRDVILVSEPEAASYFTARDNGADFLMVDDCFILADCGGGTVDVVALQVKRVRPYLELEPVTKPTSDKCGSTFIDTAFKTWLRDILGPERYGKLDPSNARGRFSSHNVEKGPMRQLMKDFEAQKVAFNNTSGDFKLDLPEPLNRLNLGDRVSDGQLTIYHAEMRELINPCINGVIELIEAQIEKVGNEKNRHPKHAFIVGGFGASPYLQEQLESSLKRRHVKKHRPDYDKSWTAVVQGAVIYGIEKHRHKNVNLMTAAAKSYGVVLNDQFQWLVRKGDLVQTKENRKAHSNPFWVARGATQNYTMKIYAYRSTVDDDVPTLWKFGQKEVDRIGQIQCDFSRVVDYDLRAGHMHGNADNWSRYIGPLICTFKLSTTVLEVEICCGRICVGRGEIRIQPNQPRRYPSAEFLEDSD